MRSSRGIKTIKAPLERLSNASERVLVCVGRNCERLVARRFRSVSVLSGSLSVGCSRTRSQSIVLLWARAMSSIGRELAEACATVYYAQVS